MRFVDEKGRRHLAARAYEEDFIDEPVALRQERGDALPILAAHRPAAAPRLPWTCVSHVAPRSTFSRPRPGAKRPERTLSLSSSLHKFSATFDSSKSWRQRQV